MSLSSRLAKAMLKVGSGSLRASCFAFSAATSCWSKTFSISNRLSLSTIEETTSRVVCPASRYVKLVNRLIIPLTYTNAWWAVRDLHPRNLLQPNLARPARLYILPVPTVEESHTPKVSQPYNRHNCDNDVQD